MKIRLPQIILDLSELIILIMVTFIMIIIILTFNGINDDSQYKTGDKFKIMNSMVEDK